LGLGCFAFVVGMMEDDEVDEVAWLAISCLSYVSMRRNCWENVGCLLSCVCLRVLFEWWFGG